MNVRRWTFLSIVLIVGLTPSWAQAQTEAADADGAVAGVQFFAGGKLLGTVTAQPFSLVSQVDKVGTYTLTARAVDNLGLTATSAAVIVQITKKARGGR